MFQVCRLDFHCGSLSPSKFSVNGCRHEDESLVIPHCIHFIGYISTCFPHSVSWSLVHWTCSPCGRKATWNSYYSSKLCGKSLEHGWHINFFFLISFSICFLNSLSWFCSLVAHMQVISVACCVFYSHCGNRALVRGKSFERRSSGWFSFSLLKEDISPWISKILRMHEFKDQICSSWFAPVGSASDYPLLSKWVIYGEVCPQWWRWSHLIFIFFLSLSIRDNTFISIHCVCSSETDFFFFQLVCSGSCSGPSDEISPLYSLWATFIGLYIANYVVERSSGYGQFTSECIYYV